jgi:hypothetical protein
LEKPRLKWEDNIEIDLKEIVSESLNCDLSGSGQEKMVGCCKALIDIAAP